MTSAIIKIIDQIIIRMTTKSILYLLAGLFFFALSSQHVYGQDQQDRHFFQLKIYHYDNSGQEAQIDQFLESAYLPALHRTGIERVGVFKPHEHDTTATDKTYVLIPFSSLQEFESLSLTLNNDSQFLTDGTDYLEAAHDNPSYNRIESIVLKAFEEAPVLLTSDLETPKTERVYELRSYESPTEALNSNKVDMFNAGGEVEIFDRLGFNAIFYGNVIAGNRMPNLMYMTSFKDMESRNTHWGNFGEDAQWQKLLGMDKYQNNVSKADIFLLSATSYSDI